MTKSMKGFGWTVVICSLVASTVVCGRTGLERPQNRGDDPWGLDAGARGDGDDVGGGDNGLPDVGPTDTGDDLPDLADCVPAVEQCANGIDDDCDGVADEACACDYLDSSNGVCANGVVSSVDGTCSAPDFHETMESSCDGRDNDCDGMTDEGCVCDPGETQKCYNGPPDTVDVGICAAGSLQCEGGTFGGECVGEVTPEVESCNGIDDDCDGVTDEACSCAYDGNENGVCATSQIDEFGNCRVPADYQADEVTCDGLDNDCDGVVDENCPCDFADLAAGVCSGSTVSETDGTCIEPTSYEVDESTCDGKDNDCDGTTDENCACADGETQSCYDGADGTEGVGACVAGTQMCVNGFFGGACEGQVTPVTEECNGADDDCDGVTDEGCPCNFGGTDLGVCSGGVVAADGTCTPPATHEADETTCDALDNDCDGTVDEGCQCNVNDRERGVCSDGTITDDGSCTPPPEYEATETTCDGLNNDCDGGTDEGCPCDFRGVSEGVCGQATRNNGGQCTPPMGFTGREAQCRDGQDNDCDGVADCDDDDCSNRPQCQ